MNNLENFLDEFTKDLVRNSPQEPCLSETLRIGWDGCKEEVLRILKDPNNHHYALEESGTDGINFEVIELIEKL